MTTRVVLDAPLHGGEADRLVAGALAALDDDLAVTLVGPADELAAARDRAGGGTWLPVVDAPGRVTRDDDPAVAVRARRDASIRVALELLAAGDADALVSPGPLGATVTASLFVLGRLPGLRHPALAAWLEHPGGVTILADAGAVPAVAAGGMVRLAELAASVTDRPDPSVGLLAPCGLTDGRLRDADELLEEALADRYLGPVTLTGAIAGGAGVLVADGQLGALLLDTLRATDGAVRVRPTALVLGVDATVAALVAEADRDAVTQALVTAARVARRRLPAPA